MAQNWPPPADAIENIISKLCYIIQNNGDSMILYDTLQTLSLFTIEFEYHQQIIDTGIIQKLVRLLSLGEDNVKQAVLEVMIDIAKGTNEQKQLFLECHALTHFHQLLRYSDENFKLKALKFIELITHGTSAQKQTVIDAGLVPVILEKIRGDSKKNKKARKVIYNLTFDASEDRILHLIQCRMVPVYCEILMNGSNGAINVSTISFFNKIM